MPELRFGAGLWMFGQFVDRYATDGYGPPATTLDAIARAGEVEGLEVLDINYPFGDGISVGDVQEALASRHGIHTVGRVPVRCNRLSPRASNLSVLFTINSISLALRACTSCGTMPASSISSTIQYQLPTVSTATGEPDPH